jgi:putative membrane protein
MRNTVRLAAAVCALAIVGYARGDDRRADTKPFSDATFVQKAATCNMAEIALGKIAQTKATDPDVKRFAQDLVADHTKANEKLMAIAKQLNLSMPTQLPADKQKEVERFRNYTGTNFDKDFVQHEIKDHEKAIELFTQASKECKNEQLKNYATQTLPGLKEHLQMAKKINDRLEKK